MTEPSDERVKTTNERHGPSTPGERAAGDSSPLRQQGVVQSLIVVTLVTALVSGLIVLIRLAAPDNAWRWLTAAVFLIALESVYTGRWLAQPQRRQLNRNAYRLAEMIVIALALRLLTWTIEGGIPGWPIWRNYLLSPLSIFDGLYTGYLMCGLLAWERAHTFSSHLRALTVSNAEEKFYLLAHEEQSRRSADRPVDRQRPAVFHSLVASWLGGGMLLAFAAALSTVDLATLELAEGLRSITRLGLEPTMLLALLVYFLLGLWLLSEARLEMMRARWLADNVRSVGDMVSNWRRASLILLGIVALIAGFLPIGSTFAASILLQTLLSLALFIAQLLFLLLTIIFVGLLSLLGIGTPSEEQQALPQMSPPTPPPVLDASLGEEAALVVGGVFWVLVGAAAVIALGYFLRDRGVTLQYAPLVRLLQRIQLWLGKLRRGAAERTVVVRRAWRRRLSRLLPSPGKSPAPWRFFRVNALPPRDQIRYFYLSTVRRASDEGVPRQSNQTPSEYAGDLRSQWPEAREEIDALTESFVEARYSARTFDREDVGPVKEIWRRVRRHIRSRLGS